MYFHRVLHMHKQHIESRIKTELAPLTYTIRSFAYSCAAAGQKRARGGGPAPVYRGKLQNRPVSPYPFCPCLPDFGEGYREPDYRAPANRRFDAACRVKNRLKGDFPGFCARNAANCQGAESRGGFPPGGRPSAAKAPVGLDWFSLSPCMGGRCILSPEPMSADWGMDPRHNPDASREDDRGSPVYSRRGLASARRIGGKAKVRE
jgi:hypothetical protein